jgi:transcriptional regulator GlxA family with amidase domain
MHRIGGVASTLQQPAAFADVATTGLAARLRSEFHLMDNVSALAIESLALEIIVSAARQHEFRTSKRRPPPPWLNRAEELIRSRFTEPLTLGEIATAIDRHPVHLARQFRRHHGCTIGDYVRRLRLERACHRLRATDETLVMIALACGFSGQAHLSTFVKRATGLSPKQYRETFRALSRRKKV